MKYLSILLIIFLSEGIFASSYNSEDGQYFWWQPQYSELISYLNNNGKTLKCSYSAGEIGADTVYLTLSILNNSAIMLKIDGPGSATLEEDPSSGTLIPRQGRAIFLYLDLDKDGIPEKYRDLTSPYKEDREKYYIIDINGPNKNVVFLWDIGIAYIINKYLNGIESVLPKR